MIKLSISRQNNDYPVKGWQEIKIETAKQLISIVRKYPYSIFTFDKGYRSSKSVNKINNIIIFDFDNTDKDKIITMKQVLNILKENNLKGILIETKSSNKEKQGVIAERFRLIIPCNDEINEIDKEIYKRYMENVAKSLGIYDYVDKSAFDLSRMFKPSPEQAKILANNGERLDNLKLYEEAKKQIEQEREKKLKELEEKFKNISKSNIEISDKYLTYIDIDAILNIPIYDWIRRFDNVIEKKEGRYTYLHEKGIHKYSIINDNVAHDFIEDKTYNTLSYLYEKLNVNSINELGRKLKELGYDFIQINYQAINKAVDEALETAKAKNDREFEDYLKKYFNVKYVKLDKKTLKIANIEIDLQDLGYEKIDIINRFRENRKRSKQNNQDKDNEVIKININKDNNKKKRYINNHLR